MKHKFTQKAMALLLALVCIMGILPLSAFAAEAKASAPGSITQKSSAYMTIGGQSVRYRAASSTINNVGLPYVFNEQVDVPGYGTTRALCAHQKGTLGPAANGQKWNYKSEANSATLKVLLTYVYAHTYMGKYIHEKIQQVVTAYGKAPFEAVQGEMDSCKGSTESSSCPPGIQAEDSLH